ncbi:putative glutamine amidotransferase [Desulforamulus putei DSM 12395]|uniref:Putative glutamine amidotransferase n=2 Tax=Desulforamulus putei TaxID=74701 RepID=A0A1M4ZN03_9FIRM|nr:putative glutamine amidotransferase [Desulforamulus putei DSM 12395]
MPVIGITSSYDRESGRTFLSRYYVQAVEAAGGLPLVLPCILSEGMVDKILGAIDGLLLSGGVDVDPLLFGEEPHPAMGDICPQRDRFELALTKRALAMDMPILAICRGIQVLNVAAGGTLCQDIGSAIRNPLKHDQLAPRWYGTHTIHILADSKLAAVWGDTLVVNSFHHQAVDRVAEGFRATAWSADGVVEGMESTVHSFVVGVQCHPECMYQDPRILALFKSFVEAAGK